MNRSELDFLAASGYTVGNCGAVARACITRQRFISLSAVFEIVSSTTFERKRMSTKTSFKRLALGVVVAIGLGFLSNTPSQAVVSDEVLTLSGTTGLTAVVNESTTAVTATLTFFASAQSDSRNVRATVTGPAGSSASVRFRVTGNDTVNVTTRTNSDLTSESDTVTASAGNAVVKYVGSVQAYGFSAVGTYTVTVYEADSPSGPWLKSSTSSNVGTLFITNSKRYIKFDLDIVSELQPQDVEGYGFVLLVAVAIA